MNRHSPALEELSKWTVGGGILVMALFPLAIPILVLTAVAGAPLLLVPLAGALALAVIAAPLLLVWALARAAVRALRPGGTAEPRRPEVQPSIGVPPASP